jgi:hypothetical protein
MHDNSDDATAARREQERAQVRDAMIEATRRALEGLAPQERTAEALRRVAALKAAAEMPPKQE